MREVSGEALHISETIAARLSPLLVTASETIHVSDTAPARYLNPLQVSALETLHVDEGDLGVNFFIFRSEAQDLVKSLSENLHVTETIKPRLTPLLLTVAPETVHVSEAATVTRTLTVTVASETLHVSEVGDAGDAVVRACRARRCTSARRAPSRATSRGR